MIEIRKSDERGIANHGWLVAKHSFSFGDYFDRKHMGFGLLRVINEDRIQGGMGFSEHPHKDMEIVTYIVTGALEHTDSMGNQAVILPGEIQRMSAGEGVSHSEHNHLPDMETHLFQIWILPERQGIVPSYGQKSFETELKNNKLVLVISKEGRDGSISINQDADISIARLKKSDALDYSVRAGRGLWIQVVKGSFELAGIKVEAGDGISLEGSKDLKIQALIDGEILLFDLIAAL
jgi:redox-sensitive bicupin YhaK (pirin superfamily)